MVTSRIHGANSKSRLPKSMDGANWIIRLPKSMDGANSVRSVRFWNATTNLSVARVAAESFVQSKEKVMSFLLSRSVQYRGQILAHISLKDSRKCCRLWFYFLTWIKDILFISENRHTFHQPQCFSTFSQSNSQMHLTSLLPPSCLFMLLSSLVGN
jgi:hypothetical protein